jgi:hypothetical protein
VEEPVYKIVGKRREQPEEIDEFETLEEAKEALDEYRLAYNMDQALWTLWIEADGTKKTYDLHREKRVPWEE